MGMSRHVVSTGAFQFNRRVLLGSIVQVGSDHGFWFKMFETDVQLEKNKPLYISHIPRTIQ